MRNKILLFVLSFGAVIQLKAQSPLIKAGTVSTIHVENSEKPVVHTAVDILKRDINTVLGSRLTIDSLRSNTAIVAGTIGQSKEIDRLAKAGLIDLALISNKWEGFLLKTIRENGKTKLVIAGSDSRGTAYGILELSRLIGVSPWEWWADATPAKKRAFIAPDSLIVQSPSVQYRGAFLNDEDWGLLPWSSQTFEPEGKLRAGIDSTKTGQKRIIGPKTYARIFELLLRLRANTIWPAMHEVTVPFYFVDGTKQIADKYGIIVGTSHCEPMMRNSASEWEIAGQGRYNYVTNRDAVISYWTERLKELKGSENIYTIGMRGKHDGQMEGVKTVEEYKTQLIKVIADQQELLHQYIADDPAQIPQAFVPYKEVLDVYNAGLQVPEHVTLVWSDDNFGYIRHFPTEAENKRAGGNGVYYHLSYWGRPHDYLWLGTASPYLEYQQMTEAYEKGVRKLWIVNVGDIKPLEYQTELFFDLAWNIKSVTTVNLHLKNFLTREFGKQNSTALLEVMQEHYRLSFIYKPEHLGNSRVYDEARAAVTDLPWSESAIRKRLSEYNLLAGRVEEVSALIPATKKDAFFELVYYPVQAAAQMNNKMLNGQLARHGKADSMISEKAFDSIRVLTDRYNSLNQGKWQKMMDYKPRKLPVFEPLKRITVNTPMVTGTQPVYKWNGADGAPEKASPLAGLGYEGKAVEIPVDRSLNYSFDNWVSDSVKVEIRLVPTHAVTGHQLRFLVSLDDGEQHTFNYETEEGSEEWKGNVLRNQAVRTVTLPVSKRPSHHLIFTAIDEGVVLDQVMLYNR